MHSYTHAHTYMSAYHVVFQNLLLEVFGLLLHRFQLSLYLCVRTSVCMYVCARTYTSMLMSLCILRICMCICVPMYVCMIRQANMITNSTKIRACACTHMYNILHVRAYHLHVRAYTCIYQLDNQSMFVHGTQTHVVIRRHTCSLSPC
jgi:hypothetical protein